MRILTIVRRVVVTALTLVALTTALDRHLCAQGLNRAQGRAYGKRGELPVPQKVIVSLLPNPPVITAKQREQLEKAQSDRLRPPNVSRNVQVTKIAGPPPDSETKIDQNSPLIILHSSKAYGALPSLQPDPPSDLVAFLASAVQAGEDGGGILNETSVAQAGKFVFYTGNWYASRSTDGGMTWLFIDPFADMPDFVSDQDVIYDRGRHMFLWYREGNFDSTGKNRILLSASTDGGASWCQYNFTPSMLNGAWTENQAFDYPSLALSNNYLYMMTGIRGKGTPSAVVMRSSLDLLASCSGGTFFWWGQVSFWGGPVQGATSTMYFGDHRGKSGSFRIYRQAENSTGITWKDVSIPGWQLQQGDTCLSLDKQNWCARSSSVVRGGWVANGNVGFMWHGRAGKGFPFPYIEAATFSEKNFARVGRPLIWSKTAAWQYPFVSPNARGDLGATAFFGSPSSFPTLAFLLSDDFSPKPVGSWEAHVLLGSGAGAPAWGDYVRNRAFQPSQLGWVSSGWINRTRSVSRVPLFFILARGRDVPSVSNYFQK